MPITKSAEKALRQSKQRRRRNLKKKEAYKSVLKRAKKFVAAKKLNDALKLLPLVYKALDKAAKTKVIEKNKAARLKSRLAKLIKKAAA